MTWPAMVTPRKAAIARQMANSIIGAPDLRKISKKLPSETFKRLTSPLVAPRRIRVQTGDALVEGLSQGQGGFQVAQQQPQFQLAELHEAAIDPFMQFGTYAGVALEIIVEGEAGLVYDRLQERAQD